MFDQSDFMWLMILIIVSVTISLIFTYIYVKHIYRGINHWIYGAIFSTLGFNLYIFGNINNRFIIFFLGNLFVILGLFFFYHGTNRFIGYRSKNYDIITILVIGIIALFYFYLFNYNIQARRLIVALITVYIMGKQLKNIYVKKNKSLGNFIKPIAIITLGIFILQLTRIILIFSNQSNTIAFGRVTYDLLIINFTGYLTVLLSFCITVLINIRAFKDLRAERQRLKDLSLTDYLTVLPNRRMLLQHLEDLISNERDFTLALFDLDGFKHINDTYGHDMGDEVIKAFANRIIEYKSNNDFICRYGGDEFIYVTLKSKEETLESITLLKDRLTDTSLNVNNIEIKIKTSIGISTYPNDSQTPDDIIRKADVALYQVKLKNKGNIEFYSNIKNVNII